MRTREDELANLLMVDEEMALRREALSHLKPLYDLKHLKAEYERGIKMFDPSAWDYGKFGALRRYLYDHEGERLRDDETGLEAWLEFAGYDYVYEPVQKIAAADGALFARLLELGCLEINHAKVKEETAAGRIAIGHIDQYRRAQERSRRLRIERVEDGRQ
ncbi:MAG TPA: hypothetical protein VNP04_11385 [Alphaproteobacteria bacterium]|nr:hypothetical protein [Alphaproteobacteria bacterium]